MARGVDIEMLRELFGDKRVHITKAIVDKVEVLLDNSKVRCQVRVMPEEYEVIAEVSWGIVGPEAGDFQIPQVNDLVLMAYDTIDGEAYIIGRLTNTEDKLPQQAKLGHRVVKSLDGKKLYLLSGEAILLGSGGVTDPDEPLVLGNVMAEALGALYTRLDTLYTKLIAGPIGMGNLGSPVPTYPALVTDLTAEQLAAGVEKEEFVDNALTNILSTIAFTER